MRFISPPNLQAYYQQVWILVRQIPRGRVAAYGQIAVMLPAPAGVDFESYKAFGPRWVGGAMASCPEDVPWQRVVNAQGKISERPGAGKQRSLLEEEGIEFVKDRIDMKKFGWQGLDEARLPQQKGLF
jgi:methylated-DNA-protein-cysteine methyltransferase-like protein